MISQPLVAVAQQELGETLAAVRFAFHEAHPAAPLPDDADVMAALIQAFELTTDDPPRPAEGQP